jgi:diguanylate cyclase (GGDEF)-like protein
MKRTRLAHRLVRTLAAMLLPLVAAAGTGVLMFHTSIGDLERFGEETVDESQRLELARDLLTQADDVGEDFAESADPSIGEQFDTIAAQIDRNLEDLTLMNGDQSDDLVIAARTQWERAFDHFETVMAKPNRTNADLDSFHDHIDEASSSLADLYSVNAREVASEVSALRANEQFQLSAALASLVLGLVLAAVLARRVRRSIATPLLLLEEAATRFGSDDLAHRVILSSDDELGNVGSAFNAMAAQLQETRNDLHHQARHDSLTALPNRALFLERLDHAISRARRRGSSLAVLYLDLDGFKAVNDTFGHEAGDELLIRVAERLRHSTREEDTVARLGGDEFAILLEEADAEGAADAADRLGRAFEAPLSIQAGDMVIGASIGVATRGSDQALEELLRQADTAMYAAKTQGPGGWVAFGSDLDAGVVRAQTLRVELQRAIQQKEFVVHYQPVVNLTTGAIDGVEALVRWDHPERGLLLPAEFLDAAEESGLILAIDKWVMEEASQQVRAWQMRFPGAEGLSAFVNLSAKQLQHPGLSDEVAAALTSSGLAPEHLTLELTEMALVRDTDTPAQELARLRDHGVQIALDDFGTGYSSLSHLLRFPIDIIKIDRSFVSAIGSGGQPSEVASAIVTLSKNLGLRTVAEGIEDAAQLRSLCAFECELGQGWFFARALPAAALEELLLRGANFIPELLGAPC